MAIPLFVLTVGDARLSAGWLLPVLLTADLFAIVYYRRHAAANRLFTLFPWVVIGLAAGTYALGYPEQLLQHAGWLHSAGDDDPLLAANFQSARRYFRGIAIPCSRSPGPALTR